MKTKTLITASSVFAVIIIIYCLATPFFRFGFPSGLPKGDSAYIFCSVNTNALRYFEPKSKGVETILQLVETNSVDVLCLQELDCYDELPDSTVQNVLKPIFPFVFRKGGVVLASRYPIINSRRHWFESTLGTYIYCDIAMGEDTVRVFNLHLQTTGINNARNQFTEEHSFEDKLHIINEHMDKYEEIRWNQAQAVAKDVSASPYPVVLMGDFNSHPLSRVYKLLSTDMGDSFMEKGSGFGTTYRGLKGVVRTDYILHDKSIKCLGFKKIKDNISDHYAIVSSLDLSADNE
ncbi:MAG: endonuclease/exonuclease/phosphatase family protein [Bacteroidales bacterium]|nr:endonuclease/exonuclease/phosphatase family protein [Bacteroidales bacterium]